MQLIVSMLGSRSERRSSSSTAQKMLGRSDIRMTLGIYTHATDDIQDAAIAALEEAVP